MCSSFCQFIVKLHTWGVWPHWCWLQPPHTAGPSGWWRWEQQGAPGLHWCWTGWCGSLCQRWMLSGRSLEEVWVIWKIRSRWSSNKLESREVLKKISLYAFKCNKMTQQLFREVFRKGGSFHWTYLTLAGICKPGNWPHHCLCSFWVLAIKPLGQHRIGACKRNHKVALWKRSWCYTPQTRAGGRIE